MPPSVGNKRDKDLAEWKIRATFVPGKMAEWSIAAVLKTVELQGSGGSNPSLSAEDGREDVRRGAGIREATAGRFAGRLSCFMFYAVPGREGVPCLPGQ